MAKSDPTKDPEFKRVLGNLSFLLAAATSLAAHNNSALAETRPCRSMEYERNAYIICEVDLRKQGGQALLEAVRRDSLCVSLGPAASSGRRGGQAAIRHQRRHVRSSP